jgi:hypothetical protein
MAKCRYCDNEGVSHVTNIRGGRAETYHVCEAHSQEPEPKADGVPLRTNCPKCGFTVKPGWRDTILEMNLPSQFVICDCGNIIEAPRPGKNH